MAEDYRPIYGLLAEFKDINALTRAAHRVNQEGFKKFDAFSPYPSEELIEAMGVRRSRLPRIIFAGGVVGCLTGYFMQYWVHVIDYPLNIGGKPFNSWVNFIPITFELTVLFAAFSAVIGMLALNGLPQPYHPVFNVPRFQLASRNGFFLLIEAADAKFKRTETAHFLYTLGATEVSDVEP
jgi:hypothetical protein